MLLRQWIRKLWRAGKRLGRPLLTGLNFTFGWLADLLEVLAPCRFSLLVLLIGGGTLWRLDQGQDVLRSFAEWNGSDSRVWLSLSILLLSITLWAFSTWYWARVILYLRFPGMRGDSPRRATLRVLVPRALGVAAFLLLALAFLRASRSYPGGVPVPRLQSLAIACLLMAIIFLVFVHYRRDLVRGLRAFLSRGAGARRRLALLPPTIDERAQFSSTKELPPITRWLVGSFSVLALVMGGLFAWQPQRIGVFLGTVPILLLTAATWVLFGTLLVFVARRFRVPAFTILIAFAVLFSYWNDNHAVPTVPAPLVRSSLQSIEEHFRDWYRQRGNQGPVFLVAAEGGGIRAAYWTAKALAELQDQNREFASRVYAISSVSGGSLGAAVFTALAREELQGGDTRPSAIGGFSYLVDEILKRDFLSPTLARLVGPDLLQRFFPIALTFRSSPVTDRGAALEDGWAAAWEDSCRAHRLQDCKRFAEPFLSLWKGNVGSRLPALVLNATHVESGRRMIVTNLPFQVEDLRTEEQRDPNDSSAPPAGRGEAGEFRDAFDLLATLDADLPLKSAVHNSSRFMYISPAGALVPRGERKVVGHVVDGGYFENSGAASLLQILRVIEKACMGQACSNEIYVLYLRNYPVDPDLVLDAAAPVKSKRANRFANETFSPPGALLQSRLARGTFAVASLRQETLELRDHFFTLAPCVRLLDEARSDRGRAPLPLGWSLSTLARQTMTTELRQPCDGVDNPAQVLKIRGVLRPNQVKQPLADVSKKAEALVTAPSVM